MLLVYPLLAALFEVESQSKLASTVKLLADFATIGALIFAGVAILVGLAQLKDTQKTNRISRTLEFGRRWSDLDFSKQRTTLYELLYKQPAPTLAELLAALSKQGKTGEELNAAVHLRIGMKLVLNFYEEMGVAYKHGALDNSVLSELFSSQISFLCEKAGPYMTFLQKGDRVLSAQYPEFGLKQPTACQNTLLMSRTVEPEPVASDSQEN